MRQATLTGHIYYLYFINLQIWHFKEVNVQLASTLRFFSIIYNKTNSGDFDQTTNKTNLAKVFTKLLLL